MDKPHLAVKSPACPPGYSVRDLRPPSFGDAHDCTDDSLTVADAFDAIRVIAERLDLPDVGADGMPARTLLIVLAAAGREAADRLHSAMFETAATEVGHG